MKKLFFLFLALVATTSLWAHDFQVGDLYYKITSSSEPYTVEVSDAVSSITTAIIPSTVTYNGTTYSVTGIGDYTFSGCYSLTSITIPNCITSIGHFAFEGCPIVDLVWNAQELQDYPEWIFERAQQTISSVEIGDDVICLPDDFLIGMPIEYMNIPMNVKKVGKYLFEECHKLRKVICEGAFSSEGNAFIQCYALDTIIVPADMLYLEYESYILECPKNIRYIEINSGCLSNSAFEVISRNYKTLTVLKLAATTNTTLEDKAFYDCYKLESISLPSQLENIPYMAIAECVNMQSITIPATVVEIDDRAFENCRMLSSVVFAENGALTRIGNWAFYNNHELTNLVIPEGVTEVGHAAFYGCVYLDSLVLPSSLESIADNGFAQCVKLRAMTVNAVEPPVVNLKTFENVDRSIPVYVPAESVAKYKAAEVWKEFFIRSNVPAANENVECTTNNVQKILRNGQLFILRDGIEYNAMGAEIQ